MAGDDTVSFAMLVVSLAATTAVHLGDVPDRASGAVAPPNLAAASQMIELLALLEEKTAGNLSDLEAEFLDRTLTELRARFRQVKQGGGRIVEP